MKTSKVDKDNQNCFGGIFMAKSSEVEEYK